MSLDSVLFGAYFSLLAGLALIGLHRSVLVALWARARRRSVPVQPTRSDRPRVTVQLPVFNEPRVAIRLLDAVANLRYPREALEIQVLDDSTDTTSECLQRRVAELRHQGLDVMYLHRADRHGYKAGALAAGLRRARGEFICVFDADFAPAPDFLERVLPHFDRPDVGMVQARWGHLNRGSSALTQVQALFLDAHFAIEQAARAASGRFFNFNGTAGVWRRQAIEQAGGWQHDTLTEDLDLSYRAQLAGWRFVYVNEPAAPAELPVDVSAFKSQQYRWTKGAVQTARKLLGKVWRSRVPLRVKLEATIHMLANASYVLMMALSALLVPTMLLRHARGYDWMVWIDLPVLACATGSVCVFLLAGQHGVGRRWWRQALWLFPAMALGIGIAPNNSRAVLDGLDPEPGTFVRTPKRGAVGSRCPHPTPHHAPPLPWVETAFTLWFAVACGVAVVQQLWALLPILLLFFSGYCWVAAMTLAERAEAVHVRPSLRATS